MLRYLCINRLDGISAILNYGCVARPGADSGTTIEVAALGASCCGQGAHPGAVLGIVKAARTKFSTSLPFGQVWMYLSNRSEFTSFCRNPATQYTQVRPLRVQVFRVPRPARCTSEID